MTQRVLGVALLLALAAEARAGQAAAPWPGHPIRVLLTGYSMIEGDWDRWKGVFDVIHFSLIGSDEAQVDGTLQAASERGMKVLVSANAVYDAARHQVDQRKVEGFVRGWGSHPGLYGFLLEATYTVPLEDQRRVYDALKKAAPTLPLWTEFSSTDAKTWRTCLNQDACDVIATYNYPCETSDSPDSDCSARVRYSTEAYRRVMRRKIPLVPLLQSFQGEQYRSPRPGELILQWFTWERELGDAVIGAGFYRWRDNPHYKGIGGDVLPAYVWGEVQTLCRFLAGPRRH
jgi:hypothetical protein